MWWDAWYGVMDDGLRVGVGLWLGMNMSMDMETELGRWMGGYA